MANLRVVQSAPSKMGRKLRSPSHSFITRNRPWSIRPFMLAPVLPGETLKSAQLQMNVTSPNLTSPLTGWWAETYFFYVKHRDLAERDLLTAMHVENVTDPSLLTEANSGWFHGGGINWAKLCTIRCVEEYFRNEDEPWDVAVDGQGFPMATINQDNWLDSAQRDGVIVPEDEDTLQLPDEELEEGESPVLPGFENHYTTWFAMRRARLVDVTFEDYLKSHGIRVPREIVEPHRPELLRYIQDWSMPRAHLLPDGTATVGRCSWKLAERLDKDRLFKEPGFIIGLQVMRPKVFINQIGSVMGDMSDAFAWLPALMADNPETSLRLLSSENAGNIFPGYNGGPEPEDPLYAAQGVWWDVRDLLLYGEQFVGLGTNQLGQLASLVNVPDALFGRRYASVDDAMALMSGATDPSQIIDYHFLSEGICKLQIASRVSDTSGAGEQINLGIA